MELLPRPLPRWKQFAPQWITSEDWKVDDATTYVILAPPFTVEDLMEQAPESGVYVWTSDAWPQTSERFRLAARSHPWYQVVIVGGIRQSRKSALEAIHRLEIIVNWKAVLDSQLDPVRVNDMVRDQVERGRSRNKSRPPQRQFAAFQQKPALPLDLEDAFEKPGKELKDVLEWAGTRTCRVFDRRGQYVWCMPSYTYEILEDTIAKAQAAMDEVDDSVPVHSETEGTNML